MSDRRIPAFCALLLVMSAPAVAQHAESLIDADSYRALAVDKRAYRIGDLVTVQVLEATRARSQAATDAASSVGLSGGLSSPSTDYDASIALSGRNAGGAQTTRTGELRAQVSVQVVDVVAPDLLRIQGEQGIVVNGERQRIRLSGLVRRDDISSDNLVLSNRIANADLELVGAGVVSESQRQSVLYRVAKWLGLM